MDTSFFGKDGFIWWKGVVEDRNDPIFLGRVRVRIFGWHTENKIELPTEDLPWAMPSLPIDNGRNPVGLKEGDWCWGFFLDGQEAQFPIVVGYIPGIDEDKANPEIGFSDPTPNDALSATGVPRPPDMSPIQTEESDASENNIITGRFRDPNKLPGQNVAFGQLASEIEDNKPFKFDLNGDGKFDLGDIKTLLAQVLESATGKNANEFFDGILQNVATTPISRYPLENRLMEPSTSRLARNEKIEQTIVGLKRGDLGTGEGAGYEASGVGGTAAVQPEAFQEPETPYNAKYPFNHVYESESGHVIEVDDTPGAERLHWYHRSGTFKEIHPDGTQVNKAVKSEYNFIYKHFFNSTAGNINMDAGESIKMKSAQMMNLNAGSDLNQQVGGNLNNLIKGNLNTKVKNDINAKIDGTVNTKISENDQTIIKKESWTHVSGGSYLFIKEGVLHILAQSDILIESLMGSIQLSAPESITLQSGKIYLQGLFGGQAETIVAYSGDNRGKFNNDADEGNTALKLNEAFRSDWYPKDVDSDVSSVSEKYGFLFANGAIGDVYKPVSDSDKKLVILSTDGGVGQNVELLEAIPTAQLEQVKVVYQHEDGTFTEWKVVRPKHIPGKVIDRSGVRPTEQFTEDPPGAPARYLYRFSQSGGSYPKQLFWRVIGQPAEKARLVLDSKERHQLLTPFPAPENLGFDLIKKLVKS